MYYIYYTETNNIASCFVVCKHEKSEIVWCVNLNLSTVSDEPQFIDCLMENKQKFY